MPLETMGMLMFAFPEGETPKPNSRKNRHYIHPASIWARASLENFEWLLLHGLAQCEDYTRHYKRRHDSQSAIEWAADNYRFLTFEKRGLTPFARCFSSFKAQLDSTVPDTVEAYRQFYWLDKQDFARWPSLSAIPEWWPERSARFVDPSFVGGIYSKR